MLTPEGLGEWASLDEVEIRREDPDPPIHAEPETWRERLWKVPAETRLGAEDVAEAFGKSRHWIYRQISPTRRIGTGKGARKEPNPNPLPSRKLSGELIFTAGEVRAWARDSEQVQHAGPYLSVSSGGVR